MTAIRIVEVVCVSMIIYAGATSARGEAFRVGTLSCIGSPRLGQILGSTQSLRCVFHRIGASQHYVYEGRIRRVGLDVGVIQASSLSWAVFARNSPRIRSGTLTGSYVGASASLTLGPGFGGNVLIGGSRRTIVLQPLSVERKIGVHVAAGLTNLTLSARVAR